ncbi:PaaI family thioesterase [Lentibacillus daqui]|uniref:PaaI family thioesterase n=1 Tax=Lentibacillus daqui TaxID=2911514 RepID=UPI0022B16F1F|nr:PaaI family thioesterase [Lentibacillus daqui]
MQQLEEVRKSFETSPFFYHLGFEITHFQEGDVRLKLPVTRQLLNANQILHGGVHASMIDFVLGMVIRSTTRTRCITMNLNVNYFAPADSGSLFAQGRILQQGYRTVTAEGEILEEQGEMLAKGTGTFKLIRE